jgi:hypothetical protein
MPRVRASLCREVATMRSKTDDVPKPTEAELGILNALWDRGPCTVRDVHEAL